MRNVNPREANIFQFYVQNSFNPVSTQKQHVYNKFNHVNMLQYNNKVTMIPRKAETQVKN